jgi:hypothetical protein
MRIAAREATVRRRDAVVVCVLGVFLNFPPITLTCGVDFSARPAPAVSVARARRA